MTWYRRLVAMCDFVASHEQVISRVVALELAVLSIRVAALDERARAAAREDLLREEIEQWKSHRAWSDQIVRAYLDEIERKTAVLQ